MATPDQPPTKTAQRRQARAAAAVARPGYKWIVLSNTTLGVLMATINMSILLIALPDIFRGIGIDPLQPGNTSLLLWLIMGYMVVTAVLVVSFGRLGDMFGRVRMYNAGFAVFTVFSVLLSVVWLHGTTGVLYLIVMRVLQGVGGAMLMANSNAIITDAFPVRQRGLALGLNQVAGIAGSFLGLILGGVLAPIDWRLVFLVSVPVGVFGTAWAYLKLHDTGIRQPAKLDWWGNVTFAVGLIAVLVGITYGIQPYHGHTMGWTNPFVLGAMIGGAAVLVVFAVVETRVAEPMFRMGLFRIRAFTAGNLAALLSALGRGGLMFILIIWLQGIWLPRHGYSFESTPLWAGIYMLPTTVGFLVAGPLSGWLSDQWGARTFATGGMIIAAGSFVWLMLIPVNFLYWQFAVALLINGIGMGLFAAPNRAAIMNSLPANRRGVGAGMSTTFQNAAMVLSIGIFFSLMITGLARTLPHTLSSGLIAQGVPVDAAGRLAALPPVTVLFASLLGYNPIQTLLGPQVLGHVSHAHASYLTGRTFFPALISGPFANGLAVAFGFAIAACVVAAIASLLRGGRYVYTESVAARDDAAGGKANGDAATRRDAPSGDAAGELTGRVHNVDGAAVGSGAVTLVCAGVEVARGAVEPDGGYRLTVAEPGEYTAIVAAPGHRPTATTVSVHGARRADFVLAEAGGVAGTVRDSAGVPVRAARLVVTDDRGQVVARTVSDDDGRYRLTGLPREATVVTVTADRSATTEVEVRADAPAEVTLSLDP